MTLADTFPSVQVRRQTTSGRIAMAIGIGLLVALVAMPWWASAGLIRSVVQLCCYIAIAQMWNLLAGYAGLVSVGQQAFMGVAGYMMFVLAQIYGLNPFVAVFVSMLFGNDLMFSLTDASETDLPYRRERRGTNIAPASRRLTPRTSSAAAAPPNTRAGAWWLPAR